MDSLQRSDVNNENSAVPVGSGERSSQGAMGQQPGSEIRTG